MSIKVGDKVERIRDAHLGMCVGDKAYVTGNLSRGVVLDKYRSLLTPPGTHSADNLRVVVPAEAMTNGEHDPTGKDQHAPGAKLDGGKLRPGLVLDGFAWALKAVVKVGTDGANKYTDNGWREVDNGFARYGEAKARHALAWACGEQRDKDTQSLHLAHEAWNALARLELYLQNNPGDRV
jgi:hypothetical protein